MISMITHKQYWAVCSPGRYVSILVELTRMEGTRHGGLIAAQMLDVAIRVQAIRHFAVSQMVSLFILIDSFMWLFLQWWWFCSLGRGGEGGSVQVCAYKVPPALILSVLLCMLGVLALLVLSTVPSVDK